MLAAAGLTAAAFFFGKSKGKSDQKYITSMSSDKHNNIGIIINRAIKKGITNPFTITAILAIISKESEYVPHPEDLHYSAKRIMQVFGLNAKQAAILANNAEALGNYMYGGKGGNSPSEGFKYRGRGFNQITFKNTYKRIGEQIGQDLENNPDLLNDPTIAADAAIQFFINGINEGKRLGKLSRYNATNINDFPTLADAVNAIYNVNAGWGISQKALLADVTGGRKKALERMDAIYNVVKQTT